ncbi:MAG: DinB family protein [Phycisphaerales bacterium]|nr:DinB family protein [Phycisphaerales bacterium]MCB9837600.1 DinB family protein [Phycisphaera sp.]
MDLPTLMASMESFPAALASGVTGLSDDDARWKPPSGAWSVLEIVCHLADEEAEDFRVRVLSTLEDPTKPWPGIDPEGSVTERRSNEKILAEELGRFTRERAESIRLLRELSEPNWDRTYRHPSIGDLRAGDIMVSWAVHDMLHLRQIAKRRYELLSLAAPDFSHSYAGDW